MPRLPRVGTAIALALLVATGCSTASPSPSGGGSASPSAVTLRFPGYLRVEVTTDGRVLVEEVEMSVAGLVSVLDGMPTPPTILYHRSNPNEDPPPIFKDVLDAIASRKLPIQLVPEDFTSPDYSPPPA
jgi:hypothetical protein